MLSPTKPSRNLPKAAFRSRFVSNNTRKHGAVIGGTGSGFLAFILSNRNARYKKMPLLFYFPLIVWMGMLGALQDQLRSPAPVEAVT